MNIVSTISRQLSLSEKQVAATCELFDEGATVPFLARYRKERTGGLDEEQLRAVQKMREELTKLEQRREAIAKSLSEMGLYQGELKARIESAPTLTELEDHYLPHKPKRKTRATAARELGLEPLAQALLKQPKHIRPEEAVKAHLKAAGSAEAAMTGASDIVAEWVSENAGLRAELREKARKFGRLKAGKRRGGEDPKETYRDYYEFDQSVARVSSHQVLAIDRGEREKVLSVSLELEERDWQQAVRREYRVFPQSPWASFLQSALDDGMKRLLLPALEREIRNELSEKAQQHAIKVFGDNLTSLLLVPPLGNHTVLALDPGFRSGCKVAVVDPTGRLLTTDTIYPHPPQKQERQSLDTLRRLVERHGVTVIAIGNGTASRETEQLVAQLETPYLIVSEAGASVYSASPLAKAEFPDLDVSIRGAVSIARRVLDPLAELIKIDPKSVGVGMYQHDLDQSKLDKELAAVVESVVHKVGVELNTASASLLAHLGGIGPKTAQNIVEYRDQNGVFPDRKTLLKVKGLGPKAFELAAGFIRVRGGKNPLDATAIHPESYPIAQKVLKAVSNEVSRLDVTTLQQEVDCPLPTLKDIVEQLQRPARDPREELPKPILRSGVLSMSDLYPGLTLSGTVRNAVDFGSFVDIGVKQDGLLHRSQLKGRQLSVGQVIEVEILEVDEKRGRISLGLG